MSTIHSEYWNLTRHKQTVFSFSGKGLKVIVTCLEFLMLPRCSNPILQPANRLRRQPWGLSQTCFFPVSWTCKFILCTCYFFQRDYFSSTSLLFTIQVSVQRFLLQRGLSGACIESIPPPIRSPHYDIIAFITSDLILLMSLVT